MSSGIYIATAGAVAQSNALVATDGTVSADGNVVGKLELVRFNPTQLRREGGTLYAATGAPEASTWKLPARV